MQTLAGGAGAPAAYRSPLDCAVKMVRHEGVLALYRGALPALSSQVLENAALFSANGMFRRMWLRHVGEEPSLAAHVFLGGCSGVFSVAAMCPAEVVKCRMQVLRAAQRGGGSSAPAQGAAPLPYATPLQCLRHAFRTEGPRGLYRGVTALWARDIPYNALYFGTYELCTFLSMRALGREHRDDLSPLAVLVSGGSAGSVAWSVVFPFDLVKSRMQTGGTDSLPACLRRILREEGLRGFYPGWSAAVLRAFPANGALFVGYELTRKLMARLW